MLANSKLPKFDNPPVVETVIGIEFAPLEKWDVPHFGLFWHEVREKYPKFRVLHPITSNIERFDKVLERSEREIRFINKPPLRCWFISEDDRTLVQVQPDRFVFNWKKEAPADKYPQFDEKIRPAFTNEWERFRKFVETRNLGTLDVIQCEVTYINHLEVGKGWNAAEDLINVFPCWQGKTSGEFLPPPENISMEVCYLMPDQLGRLRISVQPAIRNSDGMELIQLNVSARGTPKVSDDESILNWIVLGREWVVRGFADFTSENMHKLWKRSQ